MRKLIDISGQRFGRLVVIKRTESTTNSNVRWICQCDCGNQIAVDSSHLRNGGTVSCGCTKKERAKDGSWHIKHGASRTRIHHVWGNMKDRCYNPNCKAYPNYGGRGITVCEEWKNDFSAFYVWAVSSGYKIGLSIDRIDNSKGYSPDNCRWATITEQNNNRRPPSEWKRQKDGKK